jgi:hypothetical protein
MIRIAAIVAPLCSSISASAATLAEKALREVAGAYPSLSHGIEIPKRVEQERRFQREEHSRRMRCRRRSVQLLRVLPHAPHERDNATSRKLSSPPKRVGFALSLDGSPNRHLKMGANGDMREVRGNTWDASQTATS